MDPINIADVFRSDLFRSTSLTAAVNEIAYVPTRLAEADLFHVDGIPTTSATVEKVGDTLVLVGNTPRGSAGTNIALDKRNAVQFEAAHLQLDDKIKADEIQNVRAFGTGDQLAGVAQVRDQRLGRMSRSIDLTLEYHRMGAVQGLVLDADGTTVLYDLYDKFGISAPATVNMPTSTGFSADSGDSRLKPVITRTLRSVQDDLGGYDPTGWLVLCGDDFFDAMNGDPELRETLKFQQGEQMRADGRQTFRFGGASWENYRGSGSVKIAADEARLIPLGVPELFQQLFAPADTMDAVNTPGLVKYSFAGLDPSGKNKFIDLEVQSNPITYCTRPKVLRKFKLS